jgi:hypothetical protein
LPEFCIGQGNSKRRRCRYREGDDIIHRIRPGAQRKRTRSTVVVMMNGRPMTMPLPMYVSRNSMDVKGERLALKREQRQRRNRR